MRVIEICVSDVGLRSIAGGDATGALQSAQCGAHPRSLRGAAQQRPTPVPPLGGCLSPDGSVAASSRILRILLSHCLEACEGAM